MKIGVLGAGRWGYNLIRNFSVLEGVEKVLVFDENENALSRIKFGSSVECTTDRQKVVNESDAVAIATPISTHYWIASELIDANKHIFIEKPATSNYSQCELLIRKCQSLQYDKTVMVGHIFLYNSAVAKIKQLIDDGELGDIYHIHTTRLNFGPIRTDVDAVVDIATHDISMINHFLNDKPKYVSAASSGWVSGKMDTCISSLTYQKDEREILVSIYSSWLVPEKEQKMVIVGSKKMLVFNNLDVFEPIKIFNKMVIPSYPDDNVYIPRLKDEEVVIPKVVSEEPLKAECQWFLDCVNGKKKPKSDLQESLRVMEVLDAIRASYEDKVVVTL